MSSASSGEDARGARPIGDVHAATLLLDHELPDRRFTDDTFLAWLYGSNPLGDAFVAEEHDGDRLVGHYALVPQRYRDGAGSAPFVFSLNAVTSSDGQRRGTFSRLGRQVWDEAAAAGVQAVVGVTNDRSITPVVRQGWRHLCRLPVLVAPPLGRARGWHSQTVTPGVLDDHTESLRDLDEAPANGWANCWSPEMLRWRLLWPNMGPYALHSSADFVAVSCVHTVRRIRLAIVLKLLVRGTPAGPSSAQGALDAACAHHRAPVAVYGGFNRYATVRGLPLPDRFRPAPLNLMVYSLSERVDQATFALDTFELLDMDAF